MPLGESEVHEVRATVRLGRKTKELIPRLKPGEIAVIAHEDLDEVAAKGLSAARVSAVINARKFITGRYPNPGPRILTDSGIPLVDAVGDRIFETLADGEAVDLSGGVLTRDGEMVAKGELLSADEVERRFREARHNLVGEIEDFVENTLEYARKEKGLVTGDIHFPRLSTKFLDRPVVIVVRGHGYQEDLRVVGSYIEEMRPVLVGVDGGADALIEAGHKPDLVLGDMDSVSDATLRCGAELVVHAYPDGRAPGYERLMRLGLPAHKVPAVGTSEDLALLMAYELGCSLIVAVGTHSSIVDFLEKGRQGMASTFLVRLKVGSILVDAKGLSQVYRGRPQGRYWVLVLLAALAPTLLVVLISEPLRQWLRMFLLYLRISIGA